MSNYENLKRHIEITQNSSKKLMAHAGDMSEDPKPTPEFQYLHGRMAGAGMKYSRMLERLYRPSTKKFENAIKKGLAEVERYKGSPEYYYRALCDGIKQAIIEEISEGEVFS